jgi:hypothetical protein
MNERIRELADEAVTRVALRCEGSMESDKHGEWIRYDDLKKFAELIVQECGVALSPMLRDMISRGQAFDLIKQHFGVEL